MSPEMIVGLEQRSLLPDPYPYGFFEDTSDLELNISKRMINGECPFGSAVIYSPKGTWDIIITMNGQLEAYPRE